MRFEDATSDIYKLLDEIIECNFGTLTAAKFIILFDTKKRKNGGKYTIGRIKKANDELKALAMDDTGIPPDYIMFLDKNIFDVLEDKDKIRIVKHELYHTDVNFESDTNQYKIKDHEVNTFYSEIEENVDDPQWAERIGAIAESVYDPENEEGD